MNEPNPSPRASGHFMAGRPVRLAALAFAACCTLFAVFVLTFKPIGVSQDEWWHLKTGQWIWENGLRPPENDIFAYPSLSYRWDNHEWLTQALMYLAHQAGEATGFGAIRAVVAAKTAILLLTFTLAGWFCWMRSRQLAVALLLALAGAVIGRQSFHPRPPVISYLLIVVFHIALAAHRAGRIRGALLLILPGLMLAWANLHGGFILGGIVIAAFCAGESVEAVWFRLRGDRERARASARRAMTLVGIGALAGLFSLCTPFGWRLYLLPHRVMSETTLVSLIWELHPAWRFSPYAYYGLAAFIAVFGAVFWRRVFPGEALWVAFLFQQSFAHMRHLPLFALAAAPLAAELAGALLDRFEGGGRGVHAAGAQSGKSASRKGHVMEGLLALATAALALGYVTRHPAPAADGVVPPSHWDRTRALLRGDAYWIEQYPVNLCDFIEDADFHGRMFNDSRYAGYIIWRFSPEKHLVFTDMRYDIFGADFLFEEMAVRRGSIEIHGDDGSTRTLKWREVFEKYGVNFAIVDKLEGRFDEAGRERPEWLIRQLEAAPDWTMVYNSAPGIGGLAVYLKNSPENAALLARCRQLAPDGFYRRPDREEFGR